MRRMGRGVGWLLTARYGDCPKCGALVPQRLFRRFLRLGLAMLVGLVGGWMHMAWVVYKAPSTLERAFGTCASSIVHATDCGYVLAALWQEKQSGATRDEAIARVRADVLVAMQEEATAGQAISVEFIGGELARYVFGPKPWPDS